VKVADLKKALRGVKDDAELRKRPSARYKPKAPPDVAVRVLPEAPNCIGVLTHPPNDLCPKCDR